MGSMVSKDGFKVFGSLGKKNNIYQMITTVENPNGKKDKPKWKSTRLSVTNNKKKAEQMLVEHQNAVLEDAIKISNQKHLVASGSTNIVEYLSRCVEFKEAQPQGTKYYICAGTAYGYRSLIKVHFGGYFTEERGLVLETLTVEDVEDFYDHRLHHGNIRENTVCHLHNLLSACFTLAVKKYRILKHNIMLEVEKPQFEERKFPYYKPQEMQKYLDLLCTEASTHGLVSRQVLNKMIIPVLLACYYGLRRSEIVGIKWDAVDMDKNLIYIFRKVVSSKSSGADRYHLVEGTKTESSTRTLPLEPEVKDYLIRQYNSQQAHKMLYGDSYQDEGYVCTREDGTFVRPDYVSKEHRKTLQKLGMKLIRFHDLRHSCASALATRGFSLFQIGDYLGHKDPKTTKRYSHLTVTSRLELSGAMSDVLKKEEEDEQARSSRE